MTSPFQIYHHHLHREKEKWLSAKDSDAQSELGTKNNSNLIQQQKFVQIAVSINATNTHLINPHDPGARERKPRIIQLGFTLGHLHIVAPHYRLCYVCMSYVPPGNMLHLNRAG